MNLPAYPKYKASGVEWLGDVPEHWECLPLKRLAKRFAGGTPDRGNAAYWEDGDIPWLNSGTVNQRLITEPSEMITKAGYMNSSARYVPKGALVMALAGQGKTKGMCAQTAIRATCNQSMAAIVPNIQSDTRFLYWLLLSQYQQIRNMAGGEQRDGLNLEILGSIPALKLSSSEQRAIADFLNERTGKLDALTEKKRGLIEKLKEKRSALISRTVTKGLPAEAAAQAGLPTHPKLKPSGIDWLGDIPESWEVLPFTKYLADKSDYRGKTPEKVDEGVFLVTAKNVRMGFIDYDCSQEFVLAEEYSEIMRRGLPRNGDILFTTEAPLGNVALVDREDVALAQRIIRFRLTPKRFASRFVLSAMLSDSFQVQLKRLATGSTAEGLKASKLHILRIVTPPLPEQTAIADYLDRETAKLDRMIEKVEAALEKLAEYRTALITAAVTGKIDVCGNIAVPSAERVTSASP